MPFRVHGHLSPIRTDSRSGLIGGGITVRNGSDRRGGVFASTDRTESSLTNLSSIPSLKKTLSLSGGGHLMLESRHRFADHHRWESKAGDSRQHLSTDLQGEISANASAEYGYEANGEVRLAPGREVECSGRFRSGGTASGESRLDLAGNFEYAASQSLGPQKQVEATLEGGFGLSTLVRAEECGEIHSRLEGNAAVSGRFALHHGSVTFFVEAEAAGNLRGESGESVNSELNGEAEANVGLLWRF